LWVSNWLSLALLHENILVLGAGYGKVKHLRASGLVDEATRLQMFIEVDLDALHERVALLLLPAIRVAPVQADINLLGRFLDGAGTRGFHGQVENDAVADLLAAGVSCQHIGPCCVHAGMVRP